MANTMHTAISIQEGVITLIEDDGSIGYYLQRGILTKLTETERTLEIRLGNLNSNYRKLKELPKNYSIAFEAPEIMGRAYATYEKVRVKMRDKK